MSNNNSTKNEASPITLFVKEVGRYFMEFLETDFHKRRLPRRSIKIHNDKGLLTGVNLSKYPTFYKVGCKLINSSFNSDTLGSIQKGVYKADIPRSLLDLIKKQINKVSEKNILSLVKEIEESIRQSTTKYKDDYLEAFNSVMTEVESVFRKRIVFDLIRSIEKPLQNNKLADENTIFQIEEELSSILTKKVEDAVSESLKLILSGEKANIKKPLKGVLDIEDIQESLSKFFDMFKVSDFFNDLHELYQNFKIEDKQEFYFYFYDISYQKNKYPIFYIPFSVERRSDEFFITFDSQIYINKKALAYIVQEYNLEREKKGALKSISDRIIYLADHEKDLPLILQETITEIVNLLELDNKIEVRKPNIQTSRNLYITVSTNIYIALFDKSDEALLNDYEDILNASADSHLMEGFQKLVDNFIYKNPESVAKPIRDEWDEKSVDEKLVYKSPIPLNSEQQQILSAINNDKCKYVLVEGPPGTGKSHTITAIVFDTILKDKSVLVLSDKKEALDVVEKNIVNTLNKVRIDEKFQNPLLRLGKTGNAYPKLLAQPTIDGITEQFRTVRSKFPDLDKHIDVSIKALREGLEEQIDAYRRISLEDINEFVSMKNYFEKQGFCVDINEAIENHDSVEELTKIRSILLNLKERIKTNKKVFFNFDLKKDLVTENSENLEEAISALEDINRLTTENSKLLDSGSLGIYFSLVRENKTGVKKLIHYSHSISEIANLIRKNKMYVDLMGLNNKELGNLATVKEIAKYTLALKEVLEKVRYFAKDSLALINLFKESYKVDIKNLESYISSTKSLRSVVFGYFGKKKKLDPLNQDFRKDFIFSKLDNPHKNLKELEIILSVYEYILEVQTELDGFSDVDFVHLVTSLLKNEDTFFSSEQLEKLRSLNEESLKKEPVIKNLTVGKVNISTLNDLNDISVVAEIDSLYDEFTSILTVERDIVDSNIDLKKNKNIDVLLQKDNIPCLIEELSFCKEYIDTLLEIDNDIAYLKESTEKHKSTFIVAGIKSNVFNSLYENRLTEISDLEFEKLTCYIALHQKLNDEFSEVRDLSYGERIKQIENIVTMQMTYLMDERFVNFTDIYKADAKALKQVIKSKKKFPKDQFQKLKNAFPCILAGIRDYAEYIPLEPEIFDIVIIDEASQVSIAQAFPALIRAKKVIVLGDNLQFSNVKSALARSDINKQHLANLKEVFLKNISTEADDIVRLEKFNIKVSILDFFGFINNYQTRLIKHFRGYKELISYSNKFFYKGSLQVMKVRGVPIQDVLKFSEVKHDGLEEVTKNTNIPEIEFIISELQKLREQDKKCTVGIITPHTNQQRLLYEKISDLFESDYFFDVLKLKIMTFDTCQGEERDIIFYSMVATKADDKLNYVFISDLSNIDLDDDEGKIKAQRLNVGLSRARECIHFVVSKPIDRYIGTTKEFLQHYFNTLTEGRRELDSSAVDRKSKMEPFVLEWFYQTKFWNENKENAEILPQFELGKYLKQFDKSYNHPNYRVDFLLVYNDDEKEQHKIIIEYDGFLEHFGDSQEIVNELNYQEYYSPEDVYRQHILEGYGYKFLRINKFNLGENPIKTLDSGLQKIVKKKLYNHDVVNKVQDTIHDLRNGKAKVCPQCGEVKSLSRFRDSSLITGIGRFCLECKSSASSREYISTSSGRRVKLDNELSRNENNKLLSFSESPLKYARGTSKSKEKVEYLDSIKYKFSDGQLATYNAAHKKYKEALQEKESASKKDFNKDKNLEQAFNNHQTIRIRYKGSWRAIDPYALNNTYCVAYCHLARDIRTFRIDRIQETELSENFNFDKSLQKTAQTRLIEAPNYRGYRGY